MNLADLVDPDADTGCGVARQSQSRAKVATIIEQDSAVASSAARLTRRPRHSRSAAPTSTLPQCSVPLVSACLRLDRCGGSISVVDCAELAEAVGADGLARLSSRGKILRNPRLVVISHAP